MGGDQKVCDPVQPQSEARESAKAKPGPGTRPRGQNQNDLFSDGI